MSCHLLLFVIKKLIFKNILHFIETSTKYNDRLYFKVDGCLQVGDELVYLIVDNVLRLSIGKTSLRLKDMYDRSKVVTLNVTNVQNLNSFVWWTILKIKDTLYITVNGTQVHKMICDHNSEQPKCQVEAKPIVCISKNITY